MTNALLFVAGLIAYLAVVLLIARVVGFSGEEHRPSRRTRRRIRARLAERSMAA